MRANLRSRWRGHFRERIPAERSGSSTVPYGVPLQLTGTFWSDGCDAIARAVVSGRRGLGAERDRLVDAAAGLMRNRLAAVGAPGLRRTRRSARHALADQPEVMRRLFERMAEHLATLARRGVAGASPPGG